MSYEPEYMDPREVDEVASLRAERDMAERAVADFHAEIAGLKAEIERLRAQLAAADARDADVATAWSIVEAGSVLAASIRSASHVSVAQIEALAVYDVARGQR